MARVAWEFAGYTWPVNPREDSGWVAEEILAESNPINARRSTLQFGGTKSARRQISGMIFGPRAAEHKTQMDTWKRNRTRGLLKDHMGTTRTAILIRLEAKPIISVSEWKHGRYTFEYTAEFIEDA